MFLLKHLLSILLVVLLLTACNRGKHPAETENGNQTEITEKPSKEADLEYILKEDFLASIAIPIHGSKLTPFLAKVFPNHTIEPEWLTAEGGTFLSYEIKKEGKTSASLTMSMDDSTKLYEIVVYDSLWVDQYGVRVGDKMDDVWLKRMKLDIKMGHHFHVYAQAPGSNIFYEITGMYDGPDDAMMERINNAKTTPDFLGEWSVKRIYWSKHSLL